MVYSSAGSTIILMSTSFLLGCLLMNFVVDHGTLWQVPTVESYNIAEAHYTSLADLPHIVTGTLAFVFFAGLIGHIIKLHKGNQSNTLFDGGSLILFMSSFGLTVSNLYRGVLAVAAKAYDEVNREDSLRVMAASNVILAVVLFGVLVLQVGQGHAERAAIKEMQEFEAAEIAGKKQK